MSSLNAEHVYTLSDPNIIDNPNLLASDYFDCHLSSDTLITAKLVIQDVHHALNEDLGKPYTSEFTPELLNLDITASLIPSNTHKTASVICRDDAVIAGLAWFFTAFKACDARCDIQLRVNDGDTITANTEICQITGDARALLTAERTALNFLQSLSATASKTAFFVKCISNPNMHILDTRKTLPNLRFAQKYAVQCGGGKNHRIGLFDAFLIKENHIFACGGIAQAVAQAKNMQPNLPIEVEVESLAELEQAIAAGADIVMLDNFSTELIHQAVAINQQRCKLEVSGNITESRLAELSRTGVDYVSSGALTKHVLAVDLSLRILD